MKKKRQSGFTLVEVLIVVVIMAILAAAIIPQFSDSSNDAKLGTADFNWHTLKSQIELFKSQHDGALPTTLADLTKKTDSNGVVEGGAGGPFIYGPYVSELPENPWNNAQDEVASAAPSTTTHVSNGWVYDVASGKIWYIGKVGGTATILGDAAP